MNAKITAPIVAAMALARLLGASSGPEEPDASRVVGCLARKASKDPTAMDIVRTLTTDIGPRLAGSEAEKRAAHWVEGIFYRFGLDNIAIESFGITNWVRGTEKAAILTPSPQALVITALGGSTNTPKGGIHGQVEVINSYEEMTNKPLGSLADKIAVVTQRMKRTKDSSGYGEIARIRRQGPVEASKRGAMAFLMRSAGTDNLLPHTGWTRYTNGVRAIPAGALSGRDAEQLERLSKAKTPVRVWLELQPCSCGEGTSQNVIAEVKGRERPDEFVLLGAHLDSWDLGTGALDDGVGVAMVVAAAKLIHDLPSAQRPKRSIRVVLFGAEEFGYLGGHDYTNRHISELGRCVLTAEPDHGQGPILRLHTQVADPKEPSLVRIREALRPLGIQAGNNEAKGDSEMELLEGVPTASFDFDRTRYFDFHHCTGDTLDKVDPELLNKAVAAYAVLAYLAAELDGHYRKVPPASLEPTRTEHGMVTSVHVLASEVGAQILAKGGNAVDAAIATGLALAVVYPYAGNLGGGGFMLIHLTNGLNTVVDYRETAPASASNTMYLAHGLLLTNTNSAKMGYRASGVPGTVAGFYKAFKLYGSTNSVSWADLVEPARRLAEEGHRISKGTIASLNANSDKLGRFEDSRRIYLNGTNSWSAKDIDRIWKQPELARTLSRLQTSGADEFYRGLTATNIAEDMAANGGTITLGDLNSYEAIQREPVFGKYRGYTIASVPAPSSGVFLLEMLKMIELIATNGLQSYSTNPAERVHLTAHSMKRAHQVRAKYLGDPGPPSAPLSTNCIQVPPPEHLLSSEYIQGLMADFDPRRATTENVPDPNKSTGEPDHQTTHFSVVDKDGMAVANTFTLNDAYGSGVTIKGTGILMNNEMDDFSYAGKTNDFYGLAGTNVNAIAPGRRPASAMIPTMVFDHGTNLLLVTGSPGGRTILSTVLEVILNVLDFRMNVKQAVEAPRFRHVWSPDVIYYETNNPLPGAAAGFSRDTIAQLKQNKCYKVEPMPSQPGTDSWSIDLSGKEVRRAIQGDAETIMIDLNTGHRLGAHDSRKPDSAAVGY